MLCSPSAFLEYYDKASDIADTFPVKSSALYGSDLLVLLVLLASPSLLLHLTYHSQESDPGLSSPNPELHLSALDSSCGLRFSVVPHRVTQSSEPQYLLLVDVRGENVTFSMSPGSAPLCLRVAHSPVLSTGVLGLLHHEVSAV